MSKKSSILSVLFTVLITGMISSCAKKQQPETPFTKIQGKWKLAKMATDDNGNNQIDNREIFQVPEVQDFQITFNNDNTGSENNTYNGVVSPPLKFEWTLVNSDTLKCTFEQQEPVTYYLASISSGNLTLQTLTKFGLAWYSYNKK